MKKYVVLGAALAVLLSLSQGCSDILPELKERQYALSLGSYNMTHLDLSSTVPSTVSWTDNESVFVISGVKSGSKAVVSGGSIATQIAPSVNTVTIIRGGRVSFSGGVAQVAPLFNGSVADAAIAIGQASPDVNTIRLDPVAAILRFSIINPQVRKVSINVNEGIFPSKCTYDPTWKEFKAIVKKQSATVSVDGAGEYVLPIVPGFKAVTLKVEWKDGAGNALGSKEGVLEWASSVGGILNLGNVESLSLGDSDIPLPDPTIPQAESANEAAINMGVGMNLSCMESSWETIRDERDNPTYYETASGQGITTAQTMQSIADAGYGCVRIPVTWHLHMDDLQSEIDKVWLDRIEEIVDYALDAGLYAIINLHHDAGNRFGRWCIADVSHYESASAGLKNIWSQIATRFRDKDYRLLFEGYNEILDGSDTWTYPKDPSSIAVANQLHQDFVNAVRRTGGKNSTRNLILNTYGATATERAVSEFRMPDDVTSGHLMVQFHSYVPTDFTSQLTQGRDNLIESDYAEMEAMFAPVKRYIVDKGYPCIMGEFGSYPREGRSEDDRATHAGYMTRLALERGIVPIIWYSPMSGSDRTTGRWTNPKVKDAMIGAYNEYIGN